MAGPFKLKDKKNFDFGNKGNFNFKKTNDYSQEGIEGRRRRKKDEAENTKEHNVEAEKHDATGEYCLTCGEHKQGHTYAHKFKKAAVPKKKYKY